ncbi:class I SAM-dependent methyltransferase [Spirosoma flavum]|uniref:Class I SAM-dependent methyltransferase n=1 Tax=Spirosoma flavum TaxID=2048557 RepID=A0ABW6AFG2_9BACT
MGTQKNQAELWGASAQDWADFQESTLQPVFEQIISDFKQTSGRVLLDIGCGSGLFCRLASQQGFDVSGLDATPQLIEIAHSKTPLGHFQTGDMEELPYPDQTFDLVTGTNSFQYAASPVQALKEAYRVLKPDGKVVVAIWGKAQECQAAVYLKALGSLMPPPPPGTPGPFALSEDGALEDLVTQAGFKVGQKTSVSSPFVYSDLSSALKGLLSAGPARKAILNSSLEQATEAVTTAIAPFRTNLGGYKLENEFYYLVCEK